MKKVRGFHWSDARLLRWSLLAWGGLVYLWVLWENGQQSERVIYVQIKPIPLDVPALLLFTLLLSSYLLLFWTGLAGVLPRRHYWLYFLVQGLLVFSLGFVLHQNTVVFSLYLALTLGALVMLQRSRWVLVIAASYLVLFLLSAFLGIWALTFMELLHPSQWRQTLTLGVGGSTFPSALNYFLARTDYLTLVLCIGCFLALYLQQTRAHSRLAQAHQALEETHRQLQASARQIEDLTRQAERQRLARELHDTLAQSIAGLIIQLQVASSYQVQEQHERAHKSIQQTMASAREALSQARRAIDDLRTSATTEEFYDRLSAEIHQFQEMTGLPCHLTGMDLLSTLPGHYYETMQRVLHEGLMNIARHAHASQVRIELERSEEALEIRVRDNGVGFEPDLARLPAGHYGLIGLWERARLLGGAFQITSVPGQGTQLCFCLPLTAALQREVSHV
jgi:NarL family two-component system sensor histidine kinase YdfH